ncbi:hypothetical protein LTR56_000116 [Elasticomyces elasticus]|nr:hypothetical protein LTR56_000116 [Elasticomyces elasticus]KAK3667104.1 hypothetical protein LTR22_001968 [Elasticomyces elasticus]KAK4932879.1 hypothetical protein LTR49_000835 [Elasticomyces elasticus]KAK5768717.1 hypothetical protein LTS12_001143 [Elasticomyces elasticus]
MTHDQQRDKIGKALEHQQRLGHAISLLRRQQAAPDSSLARADGDVAKTLKDMETYAQGLDAFFSDFLSPIFYNEKQPFHAMGDTSAAQKVFDLPELLELVLEYVEEVDVLRFHQVNRSARASIDGSPRLQSRLSLRIDSMDKPRRYPFGNVNSITPMTSGFICNPNTPGRRYHADAPGPFPEDRVLVQARFELPASGVGKIDTRCRSMHVAQPPIKDMQLRLRCCDKALLDEHKSDIHSDVGVTIGDLWDAAVKAQEEHRLCPHASRSLHDTDGFVTPKPSFVAFVAAKLPEEPPINWTIYCPPAPTPLEAIEAAAQRKASEDRMGAYMAYKRKDNSTIMTLKDFEAAGLLPEYLAVVEREGQLTGQSPGAISHFTPQQIMQQQQMQASMQSNPQMMIQHQARLMQHQQQLNAQAFSQNGMVGVQPNQQSQFQQQQLAMQHANSQQSNPGQPLSVQVHTFPAQIQHTAAPQYMNASNPPFPQAFNQLAQSLAPLHPTQASQPAQGGLINLPPLQQLLTTLPQQQQPGATHDNHPQQ